MSATPDAWPRLTTIPGTWEELMDEIFKHQRRAKKSASLAVIRRPRSSDRAGLQSEVAERVATEIYDAIHDNVATNADLRELEQRLDLRFETLEQRIDGMVTRIVAAAVVALGVLFAALHYWPPHG